MQVVAKSYSRLERECSGYVDVPHLRPCLYHQEVVKLRERQNYSAWKSVKDPTFLTEKTEACGCGVQTRMHPHIDHLYVVLLVSFFMKAGCGLVSSLWESISGVTLGHADETI